MTVSPAVEVAKSGRMQELDEPVILSTGYEVYLRAVPSMLIEEAQARIKDPRVPIQELEDGRKLENPNDPEYLQARVDVMRQRSQAAIDAMVIFGIELVAGLPEDDDWLRRLKFMSKRGLLDLEDYDLDDPLEKEFVFKKFIVMGNDDWELMAKITGLSEEDIAKAKESFQGLTARRSN